MRLMTAQIMRNLKVTPQPVEHATVAACSHLTNIAENLIYDAAAPCILIGQDNWGLIVLRQIKQLEPRQSLGYGRKSVFRTQVTLTQKRNGDPPLHHHSQRWP
ncbi:hypothetical protein EVAR_39307_1 [Eumeta japonica]|uniref:Uncharacterized protein n=1 Tax=Eumeta variegata TaxID=151549 RepID=A0A4C1VYC2_EUMVA|nr:hypothetical protein EVAR_39307_1 [Eumeta japonica]